MWYLDVLIGTGYEIDKGLYANRKQIHMKRLFG